MMERVKVFVVEQHCPYQEVDSKDFNARHVMLKKNEKIIAYTRIISHDEPEYMSFGRVLVVKEYRGQHFAQKVVQATIDEIRRVYGDRSIKIAA